MDPLLSVQNDFDYPDYCVVSLMHQLEFHVLFVPSMRVGQVGQAIATISFPGTVSYGRILAPFKLDDNHQLWIEDSEKNLTIENQSTRLEKILFQGGNAIISNR
ncbi:unnamed protein product [Rotaria sp. Silwood2]|nr:unnamed protein product [Rotaria sp. Silwood2]